MKDWLAGWLTMTLTANGAPDHSPPASPLDATLQNSDGVQAPLSKWRGKPAILFYTEPQP